MRFSSGLQSSLNDDSSVRNRLRVLENVSTEVDELSLQSPFIGNPKNDLLWVEENPT